MPYGAASSLRHSTPPNFALLSSTPITNRLNADDVGSGSIKEEVIKIFRQTFGIEPKAKCRSYQRPYPENYDYVAYPQGFKIPEFVKFTGDDSRTTLEHIGQFIIQCGEASTNDIYKLRLFPLSLSGAAFTWFISLPPNSVFTFADLEQKFHDYFFSGETELKLSHLTSVKQKIHEGVSEYIRRFRDTRNRCYSLTISDRDLADLAFAGLLDFHKAKLEGQEFLDVSQVLQKALANESRAKEARDSQKSNEKPNRPVYVLGCDSNCSDDEGKDVYTAEFVWPSNDKPCVCGSLKSIHKDRQERFTFDVSKCERIFDELYKNGYIKMSHVIPPLEELKRQAYCKFHNIFSHATNDCNVL